MVDTDCGVRDTVDGNQKSRKTHHFRWWNLVVYLIELLSGMILLMATRNPVITRQLRER